MKKIIFAFITMLFAGMSFAIPATTSVVTASILQDEKQVIKPEELPAEVQTALKADTYKDWTVGTVYYTKSKEQYEVELKKEDETKTVKFDKTGNVIE